MGREYLEWGEGRRKAGGGKGYEWVTRCRRYRVVQSWLAGSLAPQYRSFFREAGEIACERGGAWGDLPIHYATLDEALASCETHLAELLGVEVGSNRSAVKDCVADPREGDETRPKYKQCCPKPGKGVAEGEANNALLCYAVWKYEPRVTTDQLFRMVRGRVKRNTIHSYISSWRRGRRLPAGHDLV